MKYKSEISSIGIYFSNDIERAWSIDMPMSID